MNGTLPRPWVTDRPGEVRGATLLEWAALLDGEPRSDNPTGVHPALAAAVRAAEARLRDEARQNLLGLLGGLVDTAPSRTARTRDVLAVRLGCWCASRVLPLIPEHREVHRDALASAQAWCDGAANTGPMAAAAVNLHGRSPACAAARATNAALAAARYADLPATRDWYARDASCTAAANAAHACPPRDLPAFLAALIAEHDRLVGRAAWRPVSEQDLAGLAVLAGLGA